MDIIKSIEHEQMKNAIPDLKVGDTIRVHQRIKEGNRERIQVFEGIIIKKQGGGLNATFTVRRVAYGCGVEKTFLIHSPMVEKIEVVRVGKARRAKLYYLRDRVGKAAKTKEDIGARIETKEIVIKGVEKTFLIHSPLVEKVEVVRVGKARRAKLYYLRERTGKASKTKEMVGARIENKMITIKEEVKEEPAKEVEAVAEETKTEATAE